MWLTIGEISELDPRKDKAAERYRCSFPFRMNNYPLLTGCESLFSRSKVTITNEDAPHVSRLGLALQSTTLPTAGVH
jgi:hypothetical protein